MPANWRESLLRMPLALELFIAPLKYRSSTHSRFIPSGHPGKTCHSYAKAVFVTSKRSREQFVVSLGGQYIERTPYYSELPSHRLHPSQHCDKRLLGFHRRKPFLWEPLPLDSSRFRLDDKRKRKGRKDTGFKPLVHVVQQANEKSSSCHVPVLQG